MRLTKFGQTTLPELNGVHDLSQSARSNLLPLKYGAIDLDGSEVVLQHKQISATAIINTDFDNTMDDLIYEGQKAPRVLVSTMRDDTQRQLLAKMTTFSHPAKADKYTCEQEYGFQWIATYPYWLLTDHEPYYSDHGYTTADGLSTGDSNSQSVNISSTSVTFTINNTSRVRIPKVNFTFMLSGTSGNFRNPVITNLTNGMYIRVSPIYINGTALFLTPRQAIYIDCLTKKAFGSYEDTSEETAQYNIYSKITTNPDFTDWMILEPGNNNFLLTCDGFTVGALTRTLTIFWSNHYV